MNTKTVLRPEKNKSNRRSRKTSSLSARLAARGGFRPMRVDVFGTVTTHY
ncbi:MAG: hypothetical protein JW739_04990 [Opitutales bacterium]|nr:hypothetical protein [Opitutales bacterium]